MKINMEDRPLGINLKSFFPKISKNNIEDVRTSEVEAMLATHKSQQ